MKTPFFERLGAMFREAGKEEKRISFLCMWVIRFGKFIEPRRYHDPTGTEVDAFLGNLAGQGLGSMKGDTV